jgi:hypothetical protein
VSFHDPPGPGRGGVGPAHPPRYGAPAGAARLPNGVSALLTVAVLAFGIRILSILPAGAAE